MIGITLEQAQRIVNDRSNGCGAKVIPGVTAHCNH